MFGNGSYSSSLERIIMCKALHQIIDLFWKIFTRAIFLDSFVGMFLAHAHTPTHGPNQFLDRTILSGNKFFDIFAWGNTCHHVPDGSTNRKGIGIHSITGYTLCKRLRGALFMSGVGYVDQISDSTQNLRCSIVTGSQRTWNMLVWRCVTRVFIGEHLNAKL